MQDKDIFNSMKAEIEETSKREVDAIMAEVKKIEDDALVSVQKEAKKDADARLKQELEEIEANASEEISASHTERTKKLIEKRDGYVKSVFDAAYDELKKFVASSEYKDYLVKKAQAVSKEHGFKDALMKVRKEDLKYAEDLKTAYGNKLEVTASDEVKLGGFILENKEDALVVNETLEFALENQHSWFANNSGLMISR